MHFCADELQALLLFLAFIPGVKYLAHRLWTWKHWRQCAHGHLTNDEAVVAQRKDLLVQSLHLDKFEYHAMQELIKNPLPANERMKTAAKRIEKK